MTVPAHNIRYTLDEYIALEASSNVKHEYLDGQIYAMAGGTPEHAALAAAVTGLLFPQLRKGPCRVYDADLRVRTPTGLSTYPDVSVICGPVQRDNVDPQAAINPTLIVEVLSQSTEDYDRGEKFEHYKHLSSLRHYVLVSQRERRVELWTRGEGGTFELTEVSDGEVAPLTSIDAVLDVRELYDAVEEG